MVNHRVAFRKLGRTSSHRWSMLRTMVSQLIQHERIETTLPKAKELRRVADNVVQLGKEGTLAARRRAAAVVRTDEVLHKVFSELADRYRERAGGYTRVLATRIRQGDAATMAYIELIDRPNELRECRPPKTPPPERRPMAPWARSYLGRWWAPYQERKGNQVHDNATPANSSSLEDGSAQDTALPCK
ncbi:hypothetical protein CBR_g41367 [Chara braunii]|uniref:Large ribosomal subunit protein bL17c n=1 Tax=Chara braunii TaxID=69332 RepID=A0A388LVY2_CHABU|nr:hypothetical protein CBR_g41367 [Chara braunii]|eukprot:GBG86372.1 hypothetical protein CBR_g41367 [Chara braunii]